jgi:quinol monooxygenase YgiN
VLAENGIVEYAVMQDCKEDGLHAVFEYASIDQI